MSFFFLRKIYPGKIFCRALRSKQGKFTLLCDGLCNAFECLRSIFYNLLACIDEQDCSGNFIGPRPPSPEFLEKMRKQVQRRDRVSGFVRNKIARDKQEERKRKAEMLVQQLKTKVNETSTINSNESTTNSNINPGLVEKLLNVKNECSSSSVITSPYQHRHSKHSRSKSKSKSRSHVRYYRRSSSRSNHRRYRRLTHK